MRELKSSSPWKGGYESSVWVAFEYVIAIVDWPSGGPFRFLCQRLGRVNTDSAGANIYRKENVARLGIIPNFLRVLWGVRRGVVCCQNIERRVEQIYHPNTPTT